MIPLCRQQILSDGSTIKVDNIPVLAASATIDGAGGTAAEIDEGDVIALTFSEAVGNKVI